MMRHPIDTLPREIDPWAFARARQLADGELSRKDLPALKQWTTDNHPLTAHLEGAIDDYQQPCLQGSLHIDLQMQCQRCLQPLVMSVEREFAYVPIRSQALEDRVEGGAETLICDNEILDVAWFLQEEVLLAMPMIAKHDDCEPPINTAESDPSEEEASEHPFAALKALINSKEHS
ncbi:DUF177 domain-containing protein [Suttonella sp. R2A3]|uniref:YceD family protein n=1 Tax=Suttonella sp. R2A3 TaxID=2908648 RepID=UPI001F32557E|nr:DUF177 domain-containing protein [Suttonella sp. R2A3]UJF24087.1 DUF177 domain-containing protein [Suttonella sp. R2A3]